MYAELILFQVPEKSILTVKLKVKVPGEEDIKRSWLVETADSGSGDAQARIAFLYQTHSEYQKQWRPLDTCAVLCCLLCSQVAVQVFTTEMDRKSG